MKEFPLIQKLCIPRFGKVSARGICHGALDF